MATHHPTWDDAHYIYTSSSLPFARRPRQAKPLQILKKKRGASGSTSMATTPPVGCPLSASPAAQSTPDPGPPSDAAAQGTPAPGPPSSPAAQSKPSTQDGGPPSGSREFICSCFIFLNFSIIDLYHSTLLCLVNYNRCIF